MFTWHYHNFSFEINVNYLLADMLRLFSCIQTKLLGQGTSLPFNKWSGNEWQSFSQLTQVCEPLAVNFVAFENLTVRYLQFHVWKLFSIAIELVGA